MQEIDQDYNISRSEPHTSKKRKMDERVVVTVKIQENDKKQQKSEGPPSDCWSWRKYGQKPIKGSPYPRGYYKCSTSKGCSAKKQVERCKTDASMLIVTYTSTHNHPGTGLSPAGPNPDEEKPEPEPENSAPDTPKQDQETAEVEEPQQQDQAPAAANETEDQFHYSQSPFNSSQDHILQQVNQEGDPFSENMDQTPAVLYNENINNVFQPLTHDDPVSFSSSVLKAEENDFYDELEELPTSSFFTKFMKSSFCEERIPVNPAN